MMYHGRWGAPGSLGGGGGRMGLQNGLSNNIPDILRFLENQRLNNHLHNIYTIIRQ